MLDLPHSHVAGDRNGLFASTTNRISSCSSSPPLLVTSIGHRLLRHLGADQQPRRRNDWIERDRALILTALLAGLRADELLRANVGDLRRSDDGAVIHVHGKGGEDRRIPIESALVVVLERYLDSRAARFPATAKRRSSPGGGLAAWPTAAPLFVGSDGDRARGALVHWLRHTFATELANADVSVYTLMKLLGHESMVTSQRYVTAAGTETRTAATQNKPVASDRSPRLPKRQWFRAGWRSQPTLFCILRGVRHRAQVVRVCSQPGFLPAGSRVSRFKMWAARIVVAAYPFGENRG